MGKIVGSQVANQTIDTAQLKDSAVSAGKLATDAVETAKIKNGAVSAGKLATDAVETAKIKNGAVTNVKIDASAGISESKLSLDRATAETLGDAEGRVIKTGICYIPVGELYADVVFPGGFEFADAFFVVLLTRMTAIPTGLSTSPSPGYWVSDRVVTGFRVNLAEAEYDEDVYFTYMAVGPEAP